ncbi:hypothetical protein KIF24_13405 [Micromonospora sp. Llam7]|uniref:hypothetical protein n=1 Tax=Micromonospora tarapacensis TaxID=2835305 RepID=UPI001C8364CC|nr:hypothetical protein [Micromonospora tarapacensis]MBX7266927.1 hypothetical protein [Micromonospora tarapacensis]
MGEADALVEVRHEVEVDPGLLPATLARDGVVLIQQGSVAAVRALLESWTVPVSHPHQVADGLTAIAPRVVEDAAAVRRGLSTDDPSRHRGVP